MSNDFPPEHLPPERPSPYSFPDLSPTVEATPPPPRWLTYGGQGLLALGALLVGVPAAWLLGIGAARIVAAPGQRVPLQEVMLRRTNRVLLELYRLPGRWQPGPIPETRIEPVPIPIQPVAPLTQPPAALNARDRQIAEEELAALQQEFETIRTRLFDLESKLGQAQSTADVESRLANLNRRFNPAAPVAEAAAAGESAPTEVGMGQGGRSRSPLLEVTDLKITLPSDALFAPGEARLLTTAPALLTTIFDELTRYPNATILISSHSDDQTEPAQSVTLTFQQANALKAYLAGNLPDYRWITIGYGQRYPVADNSTPQSRQRNRRIEIAIDRR